MHSKYIAILVAMSIYYFMSDHPKYANRFDHVGITSQNIRLQYAAKLFWQVGLAAVIDFVCCAIERGRPIHSLDGTHRIVRFAVCCRSSLQRWGLGCYIYQ